MKKFLKSIAVVAVAGALTGASDALSEKDASVNHVGKAAAQGSLAFLVGYIMRSPREDSGGSECPTVE